MKMCFTIKLSAIHLAIADLSDFGDEGIYITRINVPEKFRGQGYGRELLQTILENADKEDLELHLEIHASGALNRTQLEEWYGRYGFVKNEKGTYTRIRKSSR